MSEHDKTPTNTLKYPSAQVLANHRDLSQVDEDFVKFALNLADGGKALDLEGAPQHLTDYPLSAWPTFVDAKKVAEAREAAVWIPRLIRTIPERVFEMDYARFAKYYRYPDAKTAKLFLDEPNSMDITWSRADFIESDSGFKCMEPNIHPSLGGGVIQFADTYYLKHPPIARFLESRPDVKPVMENPTYACMRHVIENCRDKGMIKNGRLDVALLTREDLPPRLLPDAVRFQEEFPAIAAAYDIEAQAHIVFSEDLTLENGWPKANNVTIQALMEVAEAWPPLSFLEPYKAGRLLIYNGPLTRMMVDKRNLTILSEHMDSPRYSEEERAAIKRFVPWTRDVRPVKTRFEDQEVSLPGDLMDLRERLVLKPSDGHGGESVLVGAFTEPQAWEEAIEKALTDQRPWLVQERLQPRVYAFPNSKGEIVDHEMIWGLFCFGESYGGIFLRTQVLVGTDGVINSNRGAVETIAFNV